VWESACQVPLPPKIVRIFGAVFSVVALILYIGVSAVGILYSWRSGDPSWITSEGTIFWTTGLASLVGGVVAVGFGVEPPPPPPTPPPTPPKPPNQGPRPLRGLATIITGDPHWSKVWIAVAYAAAYFGLGILAAVTWAVQQGETIDAVRGLASAFAGLFLAVVRAWFQNA
jgi:hypothetical protein